MVDFHFAVRWCTVVVGGDEGKRWWRAGSDNKI